MFVLLTLYCHGSGALDGAAKTCGDGHRLEKAVPFAGMVCHGKAPLSVNSILLDSLTAVLYKLSWSRLALVPQKTFKSAIGLRQAIHHFVAWFRHDESIARHRFASQSLTMFSSCLDYGSIWHYFAKSNPRPDERFVKYDHENKSCVPSRLLNEEGYRKFFVSVFYSIIYLAFCIFSCTLMVYIITNALKGEIISTPCIVSARKVLKNT